MLSPSPRSLRLGLAGLAIALVPVLFAPQLWPLWLAFWLVGLSLGALDAALCVGPDRLAVSLQLDESIAVGAFAHARLQVRSSAPGPLVLELRLALSQHFDRLPVLRGRVERGSLDLELTLRPSRRGPATIDAVWLRWQGPLGLVRRVHRRSLSVATRAVPDLTHVRQAATGVATELASRAGSRVERFVGDGSEFDRLVEFVPGLDRRAIDWKASARHARLLCRRHRAERNQQVVLAVDTGRLMAEPTGGLPRLDHAIHAALSLAWVGIESGDRVGFFSFAERPGAWLAPRAGRPAFRSVLHAAGALEYTAAETNFTLGLTELVTRLQRRSLIVVLTDFVDAVSAELMVQNLGRLARRHLLIFVALADPGLQALIAAPPDDMDSMHAALIAESLRTDREQVLRRLARAGILCVEASSERVCPALIDRYLQVKRREMI